MRALDCCAGAGGLSLGLHRAGFDVRGVELDADACETHRRNVGPCDHADLWGYSPEPGAYALVAGGIPCQSHSLAGEREGTDDPRGQLYVPFLRIALEAGARAVMVENVRGMLSSPSKTHGTSFHEVRAAIIAAGFVHVAHRVLNAADYGVPQKRFRLFIVGFRSDSDAARFRWPAPTHAESPGLFGLERWVSVREALGLGDGVFRSGRTEKAKANGWWNGGRLVDVDAPASTVLRENNNDLLDAPGPTVKANSANEGEDRRRPSRRKSSQLARALLDAPAPCVSATEQKSSNDAGSRGATTNPRRCGDRLNPLLTELARAGVLDRASTTVDGSGRLSAAGHHDANKDNAVRLTIEQLAALQAFPPGFEWIGELAESRHKQVGNAVPPPLAEHIGRAIYKALNGGERE